MLTTALGPIVSAEVATDANNEIMKNVEWVDKHGPVIDAWLKEHHGGGSGASNLVVSTFTLVGFVVVSIARYF